MSEPVESHNKTSGMLFSFFLALGLGFAFIAGFTGFDWLYVLVASAIIGLGYVLARAAHIRASGRYLVGEFLITTLVWAMFTAIVYAVGAFFGS